MITVALIAVPPVWLKGEPENGGFNTESFYRKVSPDD